MILKVTQTGNCPAVIIPRKVCKELGLKIGDHISVEFIKKVVE